MIRQSKKKIWEEINPRAPIHTDRLRRRPAAEANAPIVPEPTDGPGAIGKGKPARPIISVIFVPRMDNPERGGIGPPTDLWKIMPTTDTRHYKPAVLVEEA